VGSYGALIMHRDVTGQERFWGLRRDHSHHLRLQCPVQAKCLDLFLYNIPLYTRQRFLKCPVCAESSPINWGKAPRICLLFVVWVPRPCSTSTSWFLIPHSLSPIAHYVPVVFLAATPICLSSCTQFVSLSLIPFVLVLHSYISGVTRKYFRLMRHLNFGLLFHIVTWLSRSQSFHSSECILYKGEVVSLTIYKCLSCFVM